MKYSLILLICLLSVFRTFSQTASVEPSVYGVQAGLLGFWAHNETKLSNSIALRTELGLDGGIIGRSFFYDNTQFFFTPVLTLEPRFYYNLNKRVRKSRKISNNSGNFISVKTSYNPDWFIISDFDNRFVVPQVSIIPTWGIRRTIGNHFSYETGIGLGYVYYFAKSVGFRENEGEAAANLHLRLGYNF